MRDMIDGVQSAWYAIGVADATMPAWVRWRAVCPAMRG